jgi:hypothetical protein
MAVTSVSPNAILGLNTWGGPRAGIIRYPSDNVEQLTRAHVLGPKRALGTNIGLT